MAEQVENGKVVLMHYALKTDDKVVESTFGGSPMAYLHGHGNLVPGLETALSGREVGARLAIGIHWGTFKLSPERPSDTVHRFRHAGREMGVKARVLPIGGTVAVP